MSKSTKSIAAADSTLKWIVKELIERYRCHTVILYGSRARGDFTDQSDYDVMGVRKSGRKLWLAQKRFGSYLDIFVYSDAMLKDTGDRLRFMKEGRVVFQKGDFGTRFLKRLHRALKKERKPLPEAERRARRVWCYKMLERSERLDSEGLFRRTWLQFSLLEEYFVQRQKLYNGSKQSFQWLAKHDKKTKRLFDQVYKKPTDIRLLTRLVKAVVGKSPEIL